MPLYRRLPKKGFSNARFKVDMHVVNVGDLEGSFEAGAKVDLDALKRVGLAPKRARYLKILGFGDLTKALAIVANGASKGAVEKVEAAKGSIELHPTEVEMRPKGVKKAGGRGSAPAARTPAANAPAEKAPEPRADESSSPDASAPEGGA
jgi:large subunit ribosomal protein L15